MIRAALVALVLTACNASPPPVPEARAAEPAPTSEPACDCDAMRLDFARLAVERESLYRQILLSGMAAREVRGGNGGTPSAARNAIRDEGKKDIEKLFAQAKAFDAFLGDGVPHISSVWEPPPAPTTSSPDDVRAAALAAVKQELKVKDAAWNGQNLNVVVLDNGSRRDGYAMYICEVLRGYQIRDATVRIKDATNITNELGKHRCQ